MNDFNRTDPETNALINIADNGYVEHQWLPNKGLQQTRLDLLEYTQDESLIRRVLMESLYGRDEEIGLNNLFSLFG